MSEVNVQIQNPTTAVNIQNPQITIEIPNESIQIEIQEGQPIEIQVQNPVIEVNIGGPCNCEGGGGVWGEITGTLSDQTDLQTALDGKSDTGHTHPLSDLEQSGAAVGQVAKWNGSEWAPADDETGGGGGATIESDTYENWETARAAGELTPGATIIVTDRADEGIILQVADVDAIGVSGIGGFLNADFQVVGDYSGVVDETGIEAGTQQGIWQAANEGGYTQGDIVIWNLLHWQLTNAANIDGTDPETNVSAYVELPKASPNVGYIEEWDIVEFDWANDTKVYRQDRIGGLIRGATAVSGYQFGRDACSGNNIQSPATFDIRNLIAAFNNNTTLQGAVVSSIVTGTGTLIENNIIENGGSITGITTGANCSISKNKIGPGAILGTGSTLGDGCAVNDNVLGASAEMINITLAELSVMNGNNIGGGGAIRNIELQAGGEAQCSFNNLSTDAFIDGITMGLGGQLSSNIVKAGATITDITAGESCSIQRNEVGQGATLGGTSTMGDGANMNDNYVASNSSIEAHQIGPSATLNLNTVMANGSIYGCIIGESCQINGNEIGINGEISECTLEYDTGQPSSINNNVLKNGIVLASKTISPGINFQINTIGVNMLSAETFNSAVENRESSGIGSTFFGELDITGLTTLDCLAENNYVGIFNLTSSNATEEISADSLTNFPTRFPFRLVPAAGVELTVNCTPAGSAVAGSIVGGSATIVLNGTNGDFLELEADNTGTYVRVIKLQQYV